MNYRALISELIGTFSIVFFATGSCIIEQEHGGAISHLGIAVVCGLTVMVMIYSIGRISGAHMNPAVTLGFALLRKFPFSLVFPYWVAQFIGACAASLMLAQMFPGNEFLGGHHPSGSDAGAFLMELVLAFFMMFVIVQVAHGSKEQGLFAGLAIGMTVLIEVLMAGPFSGGSMNPVRSLAPALVSGHLEHVWIYILAPFAGIIAGAFAAEAIRTPVEE